MRELGIAGVGIHRNLVYMYKRTPSHNYRVVGLLAIIDKKSHGYSVHRELINFSVYFNVSRVDKI